ncbi:hypothetical protein RMATCC62417_17667 [Rhizopus microsporus]|nr:hypothetical protein RMATCC62417_17667 [Rhizopus microsporus]
MMAFKKLHYLEKNIRTTLKAVKEDTSAPGPSNVVINEKTSMPTVNKDTSVQAALPAPIPSTSCTSVLIKTSKKYQDKVDKTEALKKEKEKNKTARKHTSDSIKKSFKAFCESTSLTQSDLDKYAKKSSSYFCGDSLTVKQRKPLAKHIFRQKINPKSAWPFAIDRIERHETIVNGFLTFWSTYDASNDADIPNEANLYAKPQCYMKWLHFIQKEMEQKKFIQEMKLQDKISSSYVHRK